MARGRSTRDPGTDVRRTVDMRRLGKALQQPGIDPRTWVSYGTVCTWDDEGNRDFSNSRAVFVGPAGVEVDVVLEPSGIGVTCHYYGLQGGCETTVLTPIRAGDRVLVVVPSGDPMDVPVIVAILHSAYCKVPIEDGQPLFKNDRVLVWSQTTDIEIRTKDGARLDLKQDDTANVHGTKVNLGSPDATEQIPLGTTYRGREDALLNLVKAFAQVVNTAIAADPLILPPLKAAVAAASTALGTSIDLFVNEPGHFLSAVSKTD